MTLDQKMIYDLALENHFANIQILKNQKNILTFLANNIAKGRIIYDLEKQVELTADVLRLITHGKEI